MDFKLKNYQIFGAEYNQHFQPILKFVLKNSGSKEDAEDLYQDSIIILIEKMQNDNFVLTASLKTYLVAIAKNLWLKKLHLRKNITKISIDSNLLYDELEEDIKNEKSIIEKFQEYILKITDHCQEIIEDYLTKKNNENLFLKYGYKSKESYQTQKNKCIKQIKKFRNEEL